MKRFFILCFAPCQAEAVFKMIDRALDGCSDFIGLVPVICSTKCTGISPKVLFWVDVNHASAFTGSTGIFADTFAVGFLSFHVIIPYHFGADEFILLDSVTSCENTFRFHGERSIFWTAGYSVFVDGIFTYDF